MALTKNTNLIPAVCSIQIASISDIASITDSSTAYKKTVTFKQGKTWTDVYHTPGSMKFEEPKGLSNAGPYYKQKAEGFFPGDDAANLTDFNNIDNKRFVVKLTFNNGISKIIGDLNNPAIISIDFATNKGGSAMLYTCDSIYKAFMV